MYETAVAFIQKRFPTGWGGAGVVHTAPGSFFTSVALESANAGVLLCIETGAMCEAHKYNERVTHFLCVVREDENTPFTVLSPCGVCQARLRYWGEDVRVGVTTAACALCRCANYSRTTGRAPTRRKRSSVTGNRTNSAVLKTQKRLFTVPQAR